MHRQRYLPPEATEAEVIRIDGACYQRDEIVDHEPDAVQEDIAREFAACHECNCRDVGQYPSMTYKVVAQNSAGWDFPRAHPGFPSEPQPSREKKVRPCCVILTDDYQFLTHQRVVDRRLAWASVKAHAPSNGPRQQYQVHQVIGEDSIGNLAGYDFVNARDLL